MIRTSYLDSAGIAVELLGDATVAARWNDPSVLPGYRISGLAGHLGRNILRAEESILAPQAVGPPIPVLEHYTRNSWTTASSEDSEHAAIRERGEETAAAGPQALVEAVSWSLVRQRSALPEQPADRLMRFPGAWCLTLDDLLLTKLVEIVVHLDDLAVSLDLPTPQVPAGASDAVIDLLARLSTWRHGPTAVLRALTRAERAPETISAF